MKRLQTIRTRVLPLLAAALLALLVVWVALAPSESRLGNLVKLVFVHGALVWSGLLAFTLAGALSLVALLAYHLMGAVAPATGRRAAPQARALGRARAPVRSMAPAWYRGAESAGLAALVVWVAYVISSMAVTGLAWGQVVAWNEPRVQATGLILLAALVLFIVARLVANRDFTAVVNLLMGIVPWVVVKQAGVIRHPVDPIGGSESAAIQLFYGLILLTVVGLTLTLIAWLWAGTDLRADSPPEIVEGTPAHPPAGA